MKFSEKEIRPEKLVKIGKIFVEKDRKLLLKKKKTFIFVPCQACFSRRKKFYFNKKGFRYSLCKKCFTYYMNPRPTAEILNHFYKNSYNYKFWNKFIFPLSEKVRKKKIFSPRVNQCINFCKKY